ncbi:MAG: PfkB family carbohydrate kinase [Armatimonadota bacterium]
MPEVVSLGEALIDFIPMESGVSLVDVSCFKKAPGGAPANVAAGLSKLGIISSFVGKVGDDPFGRFLARTFVESGVDISRMRFDPIHRTGLAFVSLTKEGVPEFMFYRNPSADMMLMSQDLDVDFIKSARVFHFGSITLISEPCKSATEAAIHHALEGGLIISYDPNLRKPLWPSPEEARRGILSAMPYAHVVKVSEEELHFISEQAGIAEGANWLLTEYPNILLLAVTLGSQGAYYRTHREEGYVPAFAVEVVDTTGAGDGFVAGMLSSLVVAVSHPSDIADLDAHFLTNAFRFANAVAAITTTRAGAISALPTRDDVEQFLAI